MGETEPHFKSRRSPVKTWTICLTELGLEPNQTDLSPCIQPGLNFWAESNVNPYFFQGTVIGGLVAWRGFPLTLYKKGFKFPDQSKAPTREYLSCWLCRTNHGSPKKFKSKDPTK